MTVRRIVANIAVGEIGPVREFYEGLLGLKTVMDHGFIATLASGEAVPAQVSIATEGGSGTPVPDLSIEVDDLGDVLRRARAMGRAIEYGPVDEPWGVRRFFLRDPAGRLLNILSHEAGGDQV